MQIATENGHDNNIVPPMWSFPACELQVQKCMMQTSHCNFLKSKTVTNGHHWILQLTWLSDQETWQQPNTEKHHSSIIVCFCIFR